ncbi:hypothetical protein VTN00DRAFT_6979 [Thermoascus crustaceus]|uniref:uncharacterized protein n=1 Tax=Thermoascus crustaceus TaxID=5088 RepID=UPI0037447FC8
MVKKLKLKLATKGSDNLVWDGLDTRPASMVLAAVMSLGPFDVCTGLVDIVSSLVVVENRHLLARSDRSAKKGLRTSEKSVFRVQIDQLDVTKQPFMMLGVAIVDTWESNEVTVSAQLHCSLGRRVRAL